METCRDEEGCITCVLIAMSCLEPESGVVDCVMEDEAEGTSLANVDLG